MYTLGSLFCACFGLVLFSFYWLDPRLNLIHFHSTRSLKIWLAIDTDMNTEPDPAKVQPIFKIADNFFCAYFVFEWLVRFGAFERKRDGFTDAWFVFDTLLCALMVLETLCWTS